MTDTKDRGERFIGRFRNRDARTGEPTGDAGYIALALDERDRVPQIIIASKRGFREFVAELRGPKSALLDGSAISFDPPKAFFHHGLGLIADASAPTKREIAVLKDILRLT